MKNSRSNDRNKLKNTEMDNKQDYNRNSVNLL